MTEGGETPESLRYSKSHEWFRTEADGITVGITDYAQRQLTDVVFVDLPPVGKAVAAEQSVLVLESVKTVADVYAPVAGTIAAVNGELKAHPELVNQEPYGKGWLFRLTPTQPADPNAGLSAAEYRALTAASPH
jgi:glycine cleavage system H protein